MVGTTGVMVDIMDGVTLGYGIIGITADTTVGDITTRGDGTAGTTGVTDTDGADIITLGTLLIMDMDTDMGITEIDITIAIMAITTTIDIMVIEAMPITEVDEDTTTIILRTIVRQDLYEEDPM